MKMQQLTKIVLAGLLFSSALLTTGCEKSPQDKATDAINEAKNAMQDAVK
jgi:hypothetical protein